MRDLVFGRLSFSPAKFNDDDRRNRQLKWIQQPM